MVAISEAYKLELKIV